MHKSGLITRACQLAFAATLLVAPLSARAAGIYVPENGVQVLARGGTDVGLLDTAYALQFNPAGLTFGDGLNVVVDVNIINAGESFARCDPSSPVSAGKPCAKHLATVSNTGGLSVAPTVLVTYHPPKLKQLGFGLGLWAPPGILAYRFADPRTYPSNTPAETADKSTPQRYNLISQDTIIVYPSIGVSYRPIPWVSIGATLQYIYSTTKLSTSESAVPDVLQMGPGPQNDVVASVDVKGIPRLTGIFGLIISPIPDLIISGTFQPTQSISSRGTLQIEQGSGVKELGVKIEPNPATASLDIKLPPVIRAGIAYRWQRLTISGEFVWEGWSVNNQFTLSNNANVSSDNAFVDKMIHGPVGQIAIINGWRDAESGRIGFGYDILKPTDGGFGLVANIGGLYETNAIPYNRQTLPFVTGTRIGLSAGVGASFLGFGVNVGFMDFVPQTFEVSNSTVEAQAAIKGTPAVTIGNGTYTANDWVLGVGLSYHGFGEAM